MGYTTDRQTHKGKNITSLAGVTRIFAVCRKIDSLLTARE